MNQFDRNRLHNLELEEIRAVSKLAAERKYYAAAELLNTFL
jgi:hypothetical protein